MNTIIVDGNLTKDSELKYTQGKGTPVLTFSIANNEGFGDNKKTTFINCVLWGKAAESLCEYLKKGKAVLLKGKLDIRIYEKKDGTNGYTTEVVVDMFNGVQFLNRKGEEGKSNIDNNDIGDIADDGDMPF